jgi:hypothetical protein
MPHQLPVSVTANVDAIRNQSALAKLQRRRGTRKSGVRIAAGSPAWDIRMLRTEGRTDRLGAIPSRLDHDETTGSVFDGGPQRNRADQALISAHNLLLNNPLLPKDYFKLSALEEPLQKCVADFQDIWATV